MINDRPDIAAIVGADRVRLGREDLPLSEARKIVGPDVLMGILIFCTNLRQAEEPVLAGQNPATPTVFPSQTKQFESFPGLGTGQGSLCPNFAAGFCHRGHYPGRPSRTSWLLGRAGWQSPRRLSELPIRLSLWLGSFLRTLAAVESRSRKSSGVQRKPSLNAIDPQRSSPPPKR